MKLGNRKAIGLINKMRQTYQNFTLTANVSLNKLANNSWLANDVFYLIDSAVF